MALRNGAQGTSWHGSPGPAGTDCDVAILGAGLAGLSLAVRLAAPAFAHLRILVVEARTDYHRDRTWSGWTLRPHPFGAAVAHRWDRWTVARPGQDATCSAPGLAYESIRSDSFYSLALDRIRAAPNIDLRLATPATATEDGDTVLLALPDGTLRAGLAFDTRPPPALGRHGLAQVFLGQEIRTIRPVFDPSTVMLMDFRHPGRPGPAAAVHFTYVLPSSPTRALIEDTWFLPPGARPPGAQPSAHRAALRAYMAAHHGVDEFDVLFEETGTLPMDPVFRPGTGRRMLPLGTAGGATRPSTGYAFSAIQARCDAIAADLAANRLPAPGRPRPAMVRMMDRVLLHLLEHRPDQAPHVFTSLFARCRPAALVRFLNDAAGPADLAAVAAAIPFRPTTAAALDLFTGGLDWPRPAAAGKS